jgi:hypothetical protein
MLEAAFPRLLGRGQKRLDKVNPEIVLLSESDRPDDQLEAFDISYNFNYYFALRSVLRDGAPAIKVRKGWESMHSAMPSGARLLHFSDSPLLEVICEHRETTLSCRQNHSQNLGR